MTSKKRLLSGDRLVKRQTEFLEKQCEEDERSYT